VGFVRRQEPLTTVKGDRNGIQAGWNGLCLARLANLSFSGKTSAACLTFHIGDGRSGMKAGCLCLHSANSFCRAFKSKKEHEQVHNS